MPKLTHDHISSDDRRSSAMIIPRPDLGHVSRRLFIDSRDATSRRGAFDFTIKLDEAMGRNSFKNVTNVSLSAVAMPKCANEDYVVLDVVQFSDSNIDSSVPSLNDGFAVSFYDSSLLSPGDVKLSDKCFSQTVRFDPPRNLDKLDVRVLKHDGTVVTEADTSNANSMSMLFDITMLGS